jgi:capsule polysaccharide modification protein KpsS
VLDELAGRRVLLLQGPAGPFFRRVAGHLRRLGCTTTKVNFNSGDDSFYGGRDVVRFRGTRDEWPEFFQRLLDEHRIQAVVLFGDCRPLHRTAIERASACGRDVFVFEEGYLRPDFVTFEKSGVNGFSDIPRAPAFYRALVPESLPPARPVRRAFANAMFHTIRYATVQRLLSFRYPHYRHHRDIRPLYQGGLWFRGGLRRLAHTFRDRDVDRRLKDRSMGAYFFVPLQVHLDAQLQHSSYADVESFIEHVAVSFARCAPPHTALILKHHPFDRAYRDYSAHVSRLRREHGLGERLVYVDVVHVPAALRGALGTVVINSTVGLSSIQHGTPVKCLGSAVYDMPGLTHQGSLDDFWTNPGVVDRALFERFRWWLRTNNQINGSVWTDLYLEW